MVSAREKFFNIYQWSKVKSKKIQVKSKYFWNFPWSQIFLNWNKLFDFVLKTSEAIGILSLNLFLAFLGVAVFCLGLSRDLW